MTLDLEQALADPSRDPMQEADGYRDTLPDDEADALSLQRGEIAWLREAARRYAFALNITCGSIESLQQRVEVLEGALRFYASRKTYALERTYMRRAYSPIQTDKGEQARAALGEGR